MSILTEEFPDYIMSPNGEKISIDTDFRVWVDFAQSAEDDDIKNENAVEIFSRIFLGRIPDDFDALIPAILDFFSPDFLESKSSKDGSDKRRIVDFNIDAGRIYAAFLTQYGIDLSTAHLHWWAFKALFGSLNDDTDMVKVMQYRSMTYAQINRIQDKEQRKYYRKMKRVYSLKSHQSPQDREQALINSLSSFF